MKVLLRGFKKFTHGIAMKKAKPGEEAHHPHFFWSSLMDDRGGCDRCPIWSGRWWLSLTDRKELRAEWHWFTLRNYSLGAEVTLWDGDSEDGILVHLAVPWLFSVYFGIEGVLKYRPDISMGSDFGAQYLFNREFGQWGCLSLKFNAHDRWDNKKVFQISKHWDPCDFLFGSEVHSSQTLREEAMELFLHWQGQREEYKATAKVEARVWRRPRDFFGLLVRRRLTVNFEIPEGIPEPGKGENSWDCDDDATFGISRGIDGESDEDILAAWDKAAQIIVRTRQCRGGDSWMPKKAEAKA